ncbi:carbohydrate sulfotransferase 1-like [Amphiura filiformis]|uniref:carbohydrate sulfotransferase 1-like n=1 Tax=Amphiura filiformis TaxID=82378 RepID=UPI003B223360
MTVTHARNPINLQEHLSLNGKMKTSSTQSTRGSVNSSAVSVIILAQYRTGSTFIGQLFNKNPELFYIFEPLKAVENLDDINGQLQNYENTTAKLLERILRCEFSERPAGVANSRRMVSSGRDAVMAFESYLRGELKVKPQLTRLKFDGKGASINEYCDRLHDDIQLALLQPNVLKNRYKLIRYEDFSANPKRIAEEIYSFLGLQTPDVVMKWLDENTSYNVSNQGYSNMGLRKNSVKAASNWRHYLNDVELHQIQAYCSDVMELLGYKRFANAKFLPDFTVPSLGLNTLGRDITIQ